MGWREHPDAPADGAELCVTSDIPDGACHEVIYGEGFKKLRIVACRDGDDVWAYVNCCPHFRLPLNGQSKSFFIPATRQVMCAFHCAIFRFEDGMCIDGPARGLDLESVPVQIVDGRVLIKPAQGPGDPALERYAT